MKVELAAEPVLKGIAMLVGSSVQAAVLTDASHPLTLSSSLFFLCPDSNK